MNKALDFLLRYYIIYHNVFGNRYKMYKKTRKIIFCTLYPKLSSEFLAFWETKLKISILRGNGVFFHVELKHRSQTPQQAAGFASEYKIKRIPYSRRFPAACFGELQ